MIHAHIDFETRSEVDLAKCGSDVYAQHPSTDALCLAYAFGDEPIEIWTPGTSRPKKLLNFMEKRGEIYAHNIGGFELLIWNSVMTLKYGWPELKLEQCNCTMAMAGAMALPLSLDDASRAAGIAYQKDMKGKAVMMKLSKPKRIEEDGTAIWWEKSENPELFEELYKYCKQDVEVERALEKRLRKLSEFEKKIWHLDFKINRRGVFVDTKAAETAIQVVELEKNRLNLLMREATNGAVAMCTATGQLTDWLKSKGLEVPSVAKADVINLLEKPDLPPECRKALLIRKEAAKTSTSKLQSMTKGASFGSRVRGLFQYHGASTGRWAGRRVQLQNLPRPTIEQEKIEKIFEILDQNGINSANLIRPISSPMSAISDCIRGFLRAKPGCDLIACDFSAIEARVIAWLAGQENTLEVFRGDGKIYELTAASIYACKKEEILKQDPRRQVGKVAVLALGFQGGVGAMQTMAKAYQVKLEPTFDTLWKRSTQEHRAKAQFVWNLNGKKSEISQKEFVASDLIKQYWREANPQIVKYWEDLNSAAIMAVNAPGKKFSAGAKNREVFYVKNGSFLWCKLPSGRVICYPYPRVDIVAPFEDSQPKPTLTAMGVDSYTKQWERYKAYGGFLAENVTQAVARDILAESMLRLEEKNYPVVMHVHDEVVTEVPKKSGPETLKDIENILTELPVWAKDLPLAAEGWRGVRYRK